MYYPLLSEAYKEYPTAIILVLCVCLLGIFLLNRSQKSK